MRTEKEIRVTVAAYEKAKAKQFSAEVRDTQQTVINALKWVLGESP